MLINPLETSMLFIAAMATLLWWLSKAIADRKMIWVCSGPPTAKMFEKQKMGYNCTLHLYIAAMLASMSHYLLVMYTCKVANCRMLSLATRLVSLLCFDCGSAALDHGDKSWGQPSSDPSQPQSWHRSQCSTTKCCRENGIVTVFVYLYHSLPISQSSFLFLPFSCPWRHVAIPELRSYQLESERPKTNGTSLSRCQSTDLNVFTWKLLQCRTSVQMQLLQPQADRGHARLGGWDRSDSQRGGCDPCESHGAQQWVDATSAAAPIAFSASPKRSARNQPLMRPSWCLYSSRSELAKPLGPSYSWLETGLGKTSNCDARWEGYQDAAQMKSNTGHLLHWQPCT